MCQNFRNKQQCYNGSQGICQTTSERKMTSATTSGSPGMKNDLVCGHREAPQSAFFFDFLNFPVFQITTNLNISENADKCTLKNYI